MFNHLISAKALIIAGAVAAAMTVAAPAQAGRMDPGLGNIANTLMVNAHSRHGLSRHGMLSPREIRYSLRNQGLYRIRGIHYRARRDVYVAKGWRGGRLLKVRVNPYSGRIIRSRVLRVRGYGQQRWHRGHRHWHGRNGHTGFSFRGPNGSFSFEW